MMIFGKEPKKTNYSEFHIGEPQSRDEFVSGCISSVFDDRPRIGFAEPEYKGQNYNEDGTREGEDYAWQDNVFYLNKNKPANQSFISK